MLAAALSATLSLSAQEPITRVEPLSWWVGMKTDLQLLVQGPGISEYAVSIEGADGVAVKAVHKADSPNYLFIDVAIAPEAAPGTYQLVFRKGKKSFRHPYQLGTRCSAPRKSFDTSDLMYLIVPDRFADGDPSIDSTPFTYEKARRDHHNGRHGGDLQGFIDHLDYLQDLGVTAIWSTPLLCDNDRKLSYHGYACSDYYHIDPRYGSNELYRTYVKEAHAKGIKVVMDVVTNHCGMEHWWMQDLPFKDWIHVKDTCEITNHQMSLSMDPHGSKADRALMEEGWFVPSMPDMNLDNPYMLKYFQQWAIWWVEYSGLDGLRVDTWYYNEKYAMSRWAKAVTDEYPWMNIVGENWTLNPDFVAYWQKDHPNADGFNSNLPTVMDFPLTMAITEALEAPQRGKKTGGDIAAVYNALSHDFAYANLENILIFLSNHDMARIGDLWGAKPEKMKIGLTLLATLRGIPQLFYGDELMLLSGSPKREDGKLRMDFPGGWKGDAVNLFTEEGRAKAASDTTYTHAKDLHDYARTLFRWRKGKDVIHHGKTLHFVPKDNTYAFFRYNDKEKVFVFVNNSEEPRKVEWSRYREITDGLMIGRNVLTGEAYMVNDDTVVPPLSCLVVEY